MRHLGAALLVLAGFLAVAPSLVMGQSAPPARFVGPYTPPPTAEAKVSENPPPRIGEFGTISNPLALRAAAVDAPDQVEAMEAWNRAGNEPPRAGFARPLPDSIVARFGTTANADSHSVRARSAGGVMIWGTRVAVADARGIRLHLTGVDLPPGTRFWSYGSEGRPIEFGLELRGPEGDVWTPIVFGETAFLDVELPSADAKGSLSIVEIAEIRMLAADATEPPCAIDAACATSTDFPAIEQARKAVALVQFMFGDTPAWCTGTLLNDTAQDGTPYLLIAHHCISTQTEASSVHALWDYDAPSCGGTVPALSSLPSSSGATLLATGVLSDYTLMQLTSLPSGRSFMGWDARPSALVPGTTLYRLSHPASYLDLVKPGPLPTEFSTSLFDGVDSYCVFGLTATYVISHARTGYVFGGSSGSAALLANGEVVGQLKGACGGFLAPCGTSFDVFDGQFSLSYPNLARWLDAPSPSCVPDAATLCMNTRFALTAQWNKADGTSGFGTAVSLTPDSGYFWFFDPSNVEIVTKVVSGCGINDHYWVFASGLTNIGVTLTYYDLASGTQQAYRNAAGIAFAPIQDTSAFATCP